MLQINTQNLQTKQFYYHNGKKTLLCHSRKKMVCVTKEEKVRQSLIRFLIEEMDVPQDMIEVEVPISRFSNGTRGRADLVIYGLAEDDSEVPVLVVECKGPGVPIIDRCYDQVNAYVQGTGCNLFMVTDGSQADVGYWNPSTGRLRTLKKLPSYSQIIKRKFAFEPEQKDIWIRPQFEELLTPEVVQDFIDDLHIGVDTPHKFYHFIINLAGCLYDEAKKLKKGLEVDGWRVKDMGLRFTSFGNAGSGSYCGSYRYFLLTNEEGDTQIISFAIMANEKTTNHPRWGNNRGRTTLVVAVDNFEASHNSLQLTVEDNSVLQDGRASVFHDGRITIGSLGSLSRSIVLKKIQTFAPDLIDRDAKKVFLGTFDLQKEICMNDMQTKEFLSKVIRYVFIREQIRREIKNRIRDSASTETFSDA